MTRNESPQDKKELRMHMLRMRAEGKDNFYPSSNGPDSINDLTLSSSQNALTGAVPDLSMVSYNSLINTSDKNFHPKVNNEHSINLDKILDEQKQKYEDLKKFTLDIIKEKSELSKKVKFNDICEKICRVGFPIKQDRFVESPDLIQLRKEKERLESQIQNNNFDVDIPDIKQRTQANLKRIEELIFRYEREQDFIFKFATESKFEEGDRMDNNNVVLLQFVGRGGYAEVWKAFDFTINSIVAVKIHTRNDHWNYPTIQKRSQLIAREIQIFQSTNHPNVVKYFRYFYPDDNSVCLVMEYCEYGDLGRALKDRVFSEESAHSMLVQIIDGLMHLMKDKSNESVIHYDLKPGNILLDKNYVPKITDFSLSKIVSDDQSISLTSPGTGTIGYTDPQTFLNKNMKFTSSVDTWSIGIVYYEMLTGDMELKKSINYRKGERVEVPKKNLSQRAKEFIERCLVFDTSERATIKQLSEDEYVKTSVKSARKKGAGTPKKEK